MEPRDDVDRPPRRAPSREPGDTAGGLGIEPWASTVPPHAAPVVAEDRGPGWYPWLDIAMAVMAVALLVQALERALSGDWLRVVYAGTVGTGFLVQISFRRRLHQESARRRAGV